MKHSDIQTGDILHLRQELFEDDVIVEVSRSDRKGFPDPAGRYVLVRTRRGQRVVTPRALHRVDDS